MYSKCNLAIYLLINFRRNAIFATTLAVGLYNVSKQATNHTPTKNNFIIIMGLIVATLASMINVSFKIIHIHGMTFSALSLLTPLISCLFLIIMTHYKRQTQKQMLNLSLFSLYFYCICVFLILSLPTPSHWLGEQAYEIVFEEMPKKFFAITLSYIIGLYLPYYFITNSNRHFGVKEKIFLSILSNEILFLLSFFLLFYDEHNAVFYAVLIDSLLISNTLMLSFGLITLCHAQFKKTIKIRPLSPPRTVYNYLACCAIILIQISLSTAFKLVAIGNIAFVASGMIFPFILIVSSIVGENYGYRANLKLLACLILSQLLFDLTILAVTNLPSPAFLNLDKFFSLVFANIKPRQLIAAFLALFCAFMVNASLISFLKHVVKKSLLFRLIIANITSQACLCLINYSLLFVGIYSSETLFYLIWTNLIYNMLFTLVSLPLVIKSIFWVKHRQQGHLSLS
jgi:uncharacterized PurR-regulated membrane protein YhhQ (DUF165 family)